ncbi:hypothetical protein OG196_33595 [Kitasatospora purpeofusca]|nr:hypothetical protein OG196_33595 [Kitasatospora purpeofusca]
MNVQVNAPAGLIAAPGVLSEVSFTSALEAVSLTLGHHPTRQFTH